jgi:hypothetical protein
MSYRLTEAERNHVAVIEELQIYLKRKDENNPLDTQIQMVVSDGDNLDLTIDLPRYKIEKDIVGKSQLRLVDEKFNTRSVVDNVGWDFELTNDEDAEGFISSITLTRLNDNKPFIIPINKLKNLIIEASLRVDGSLSTDTASIDNNLTVNGSANIVSGLSVQNGVSINGNVSISRDLLDDTISGDLTIADGGLYVTTGKTQLQETEVKSLDVNGLAIISGLEVENDEKIFGDLRVVGKSYVQSVAVAGNQTVAGFLNVTGKTTLNDVDINSPTGSGIIKVNEISVVNNNISGNQFISGILDVVGKTTLNDVDINSPIGSGIINVNEINVVIGNISGIETDTISGNEATITTIISEDITTDDFAANDISTDVLNVKTDTTLSGIIDAVGDISLNGITTVKGTDLFVETRAGFKEDSFFTKDVNIKGNTEISGTLLVEDIATLENNVYIGKPGTEEITGASFIPYHREFSTSLLQFLFKISQDGTTIKTIELEQQAWPVGEIGDVLTGNLNLSDPTIYLDSAKPGKVIAKVTRSDEQYGYIGITVNGTGNYKLDLQAINIGTLKPNFDDLTDPDMTGVISASSSKDLFVLGSTNITDVNKTKTDNKLVLYSSGLSTQEIADSINKFHYGDAERIKAIINGEIQYLATMEDINNISFTGAVTLNTQQTITANKYFSGAAVFSDKFYAFYDGPGTPGGTLSNDYNYRLIEQVLVDDNELAIKMGNTHSHLDFYVNEDILYGRPDSHIKVYRDNNLPQTYIPYVEDVVLRKFADPTNGQVIGDVGVHENYSDSTNASIDFTTLKAGYNFDDQLAQIDATSGLLKLNFRSNNLLFTKGDDHSLIINVSGYEELIETLNESIDITVANSGISYSHYGYRSTNIKVDVAGNEDSITLNGISGIKVNPTVDGNINIGLTQIDYSLDNSSPEIESFPTTYAVVSGIAHEYNRAIGVEQTILNRLPEAPDPIGFYTMTARTLDPTTKVYGWSAATMPPTPMTGDIDDDPADPHKDGDEFVLKFVLQNAATGAGSLVWEKVK